MKPKPKWTVDGNVVWGPWYWKYKETEELFRWVENEMKTNPEFAAEIDRLDEEYKAGRIRL